MSEGIFLGPTSEFFPEKFRTEPRDAEEFYDRKLIEQEVWQAIAVHESMPTAEVREQERRDNARTALFEGLTASGHLSHIEISGELEEINKQILCRLINGYLQCFDSHEKGRRFAELCNEVYVQKIFRLVVLGEMDEATSIAEISDYPFGLPDERAKDLGYRANNRKGMARSHHLRRNAESNFTRIIEQMSRSNSTPQSSVMFLSEAGIQLTADAPLDIAILSKPAIFNAEYDYADGVVAIQRKLDEFSGPNIQYGEIQGSQPLHVAYEHVREESARRESEIECYIDRLADFEERLELAETAGFITNEQRCNQYKLEVRQILRSICTLAPEYSADCFGEEAAVYYHMASDFAAAGDFQRAETVVEQAIGVEQDIIICGLSINTETAKKLGIDPDSVGVLAKFGKENWKKTKGVCRISKCPSPKPTILGPCRVCMASCQPLFDANKNPEAEYIKASRRKSQERKRPSKRTGLLRPIGELALAA